MDTTEAVHVSYNMADGSTEIRAFEFDQPTPPKVAKIAPKSVDSFKYHMTSKGKINGVVFRSDPYNCGLYYIYGTVTPYKEEDYPEDDELKEYMRRYRMKYMVETRSGLKHAFNHLEDHIVFP